MRWRNASIPEPFGTVTSDQLLALQSEKDFQQWVSDHASVKGWLVYHTHDSRRSAKGFPDLVMARKGKVIFAELKRGGKKPTKAQWEWLNTISEGDVPTPYLEAYFWTPYNKEDIRRILA